MRRNLKRLLALAMVLALILSGLCDSRFQVLAQESTEAETEVLEEQDSVEEEQKEDEASEIVEEPETADVMEEPASEGTEETDAATPTENAQASLSEEEKADAKSHEQADSDQFSDADRAARRCSCPHLHFL